MNSGKVKQPKPVPAPNFAGQPEKGAKTSGIKVRGTNAQTKGKMARGPMA